MPDMKLVKKDIQFNSNHILQISIKITIDIHNYKQFNIRILNLKFKNLEFEIIAFIKVFKCNVNRYLNSYTVQL